ncbi:MAG: redox-sensing transcriptional repressor Rex [Oscillospiraceae bacterium]|nr:redox-sensing transcriptional repressor Rex [Oscillospiraceae bacterium]
MKQIEVSRATMGRLPVYLEYLKSTESGTENISATALAKELGLGEVQVRKDLAAVSGAGRPKTGYNVSELISVLEKFLGRNDSSNVVIVGAGKLGRALLDYSGFKDYGLEIMAAFDKEVNEPEKSKQGKPVYSMDLLDDFCRENNIRIGVIAVPASSAQEVCDRFVKNGIRAVWCFAPCSLTVPDGIPVQYENMALSLAYLNKKI